MWKEGWKTLNWKSRPEDHFEAYWYPLHKRSPHYIKFTKEKPLEPNQDDEEIPIQEHERIPQEKTEENTNNQEEDKESTDADDDENEETPRTTTRDAAEDNPTNEDNGRNRTVTTLTCPLMPPERYTSTRIPHLPTSK